MQISTGGEIESNKKTTTKKAANINLYFPPFFLSAGGCQREREKKKGENEVGFMCQVVSAADAHTLTRARH